MPPRSVISELADAFADLVDLDIKNYCEQSLIELTSYLWDIVDPGEPLVHGWAMDAIADHLEATVDGHIKRLLVTVPPGFSKSSLTNVFFPLYVWIKSPHKRFIKASYEQGIPERDNDKCRNIIAHEKWQRFWGDRFKLIAPNTIDRFENDKTGWQMATAVGAKLIGHRGNFILIDDPNDPSIENQSGAKRLRAVRWFRETVPTRLNNARNDVIVLIQQRLHMQDCAGTALSLDHENYVHCNIPMEYEKRIYINAWQPPEPPEEDEEPDPDEPDRVVTLFDADAVNAIRADPECVFWKDPRENEGELAWPERFPRREVIKLKKTLDKTMVAAQLQQRPVPRGGNIIAVDSWQIWDKDTFPPFSFLLATLDTAFTEETRNDPSGLIVWGMFQDEFFNPKIMLVYAWTDWLEFNDLVRRVLYTCTAPKGDLNDSAAYPEFAGLPRFPIDTLVIEGKASGLSVQQEIARLLTLGYGRTLHVEMLPAKLLRDDKESRLISVSHLYRNKMIYAPDKEYADKVIDQVGNFPFETHDEYVDCTSMGLKWFRDQGFAPTREERFEEEELVKAFRPAPPPLYGGVG